MPHPQFSVKFPIAGTDKMKNARQVPGAVRWLVMFGID